MHEELSGKDDLPESGTPPTSDHLARVALEIVQRAQTDDGFTVEELTAMLDKAVGPEVALWRRHLQIDAQLAAFMKDVPEH